MTEETRDLYVAFQEQRNLAILYGGLLTFFKVTAIATTQSLANTMELTVEMEMVGNQNDIPFSPGRKPGRSAVLLPGFTPSGRADFWEKIFFHIANRQPAFTQSQVVEVADKALAEWDKRFGIVEKGEQ